MFSELSWSWNGCYTVLPGTMVRQLHSHCRMGLMIANCHQKKDEPVIRTHRYTEEAVRPQYTIRYTPTHINANRQTYGQVYTYTYIVQIYARTHKCMHVYSCLHTRVYMYVIQYASMLTCMHTNSDIHAYTHTCLYIVRAYIHTYMCMRACMRLFACINIRTYIYLYTRTNACTHPHTHTDIYMCTYTHMHTWRVHIHPCIYNTHACTHTCMHTHIHVHTCIRTH